MHNPDYTPTNNFVQVHFAERFVPIAQQPKLGNLILTKIDNREYFYGIELSAKSNSTLDYRKFAVSPLFTSLVWIGRLYSDVDPISEVDTVRFGRLLQTDTVVMPHLTCYRTTPERLKSFLSLDFANILALRGDDVDDGQSFQHASDMVAEIRKIRGDTITIGVGGYPQGHPQSNSMEADMRYLIQKGSKLNQYSTVCIVKRGTHIDVGLGIPWWSLRFFQFKRPLRIWIFSQVNSGADFIITQICFEASSIVEFIGNCRKHNITVPIIVGVYVPENYRTMRLMLKITQVRLPFEMMHAYEKRKNNATEFKQYAFENAAKLITDVFESDSGVYGIQFFSMNHFDLIEQLVNNVIAKFNKNQ